jgi:hypothetical protein
MHRSKEEYIQNFGGRARRNDHLGGPRWDDDRMDHKRRCMGE